MVDTMDKTQAQPLPERECDSSLFWRAMRPHSTRLEAA